MKTMQKWLLGGKFYKFLIKDKGRRRRRGRRKEKEEKASFDV